MDSARAMGTPGGAGSVFQDGLGDRRRVSDSAGAEFVERLCLRSELTNVPSFEFALRERASRLASFRHPCFAAIRSIDRLNDASSTLAVVSEAVRGVRLAALLAKPAHPAIDINASVHLIRQLVSAIAVLHETAPDVAHGAIAPERIVITPNARVIVVEHVLGAALEQLRYPQDRYWADLRVAVPDSSTASHLDQRADVLQIGLTALSLILGRRLDGSEYPTLITDVFASAQALTSDNEREPLPGGLRAWLTRTLQLDPLRNFETAVDARDELERVLSDEEDEVSDVFVAQPQRPAARPAFEPVTAARTVPAPADGAARRPTSPAPPMASTATPVTPRAPARPVQPAATTPVQTSSGAPPTQPASKAPVQPPAARSGGAPTSLPSQPSVPVLPPPFAAPAAPFHDFGSPADDFGELTDEAVEPAPGRPWGRIAAVAAVAVAVLATGGFAARRP